jgi:1,2-dihydroxy-3-keto-5-methylthiopentene dioxygenase
MNNKSQGHPRHNATRRRRSRAHQTKPTNKQSLASQNQKANHHSSSSQGDQRLAHDSGRPVDPAYLSTLGILHQRFPDPSDLRGINALAEARSYKNRDEVEISPTTLPGYEEKVKNFFHEHLHEDEEIRYILAGAGYFDVRSEGDDWVRIRLEKGDLMIMPAGIYHRFTTDETNVSPSTSRGYGGGKTFELT